MLGYSSVMWKTLLKPLDAGEVHTEQMLPPSKGNLLTCKAQVLQEKSSVRLTNAELLSWKARMLRDPYSDQTGQATWSTISLS